VDILNNLDESSGDYSEKIKIISEYYTGDIPLLNV
jgi:hypothetical protein